MSQTGCVSYYMIPLADIPSEPSFRVYYATWNPSVGRLEYTDVRPSLPAGDTFCVGVSSDSQLPPSAISLGDGSKDLPPPPLEVAIAATTQAEYEAQFGEVFRKHDLTTSRSISFAPHVG